MIVAAVQRCGVTYHFVAVSDLLYLLTDRLPTYLPTYQPADRPSTERRCQWAPA